MSTVVHYLESQEEKRRRLRSGGKFSPSARCGQGEPGYRLYMEGRATTNVSQVTCLECLSLLHRDDPAWAWRWKRKKR